MSQWLNDVSRATANRERHRTRPGGAFLFPGLVLWATVWLLWLTTPATARHPAALHPPDLAAIDAYVGREMKADRVPGLSLAIVQPGGVTFRQYGQAGRGQPLTPRTAFILGSMSKSFTALAVMQLVEQGQIDLKAPVQRYLPDFRMADEAASRQITVAHLLNHTSGLPAQVAATRQARTLAEHLPALSRVRLEHPPGTRHTYSSVGYQVLGVLIERVTGQPYAEVVQQRIFTPLKMTHSFTDGTRARPLASGHRYWFGFPVAADLPFEGDRLPTAGLISSAEDLATYLQALMRKEGIPGVISRDGLFQLLWPTAQGDGFSYAMGWRVSSWPDGGGQSRRVIHHGGVLPHYRGKMVMLPDLQAGVVVLTNASTSLPFPLAATSHRVADGVARSLVGQPLPSQTLNLSLMYAILTLAAALILWAEVRKLLVLRRWKAAAQQRPRAALMREVALELLGLVALLVGVPLLMRVPWAEMLRSSPDLAWWMLTLAALGAAGLVYKLRVIMRN